MLDTLRDWAVTAASFVAGQTGLESEDVLAGGRDAVIALLTLLVRWAAPHGWRLGVRLVGRSAGFVFRPFRTQPYEPSDLAWTVIERMRQGKGALDAKACTLSFGDLVLHFESGYAGLSKAMVGDDNVLLHMDGADRREVAAEAKEAKERYDALEKAAAVALAIEKLNTPQKADCVPRAADGSGEMAWARLLGAASGEAKRKGA